MSAGQHAAARRRHARIKPACTNCMVSCVPAPWATYNRSHKTVRLVRIPRVLQPAQVGDRAELALCVPVAVGRGVRQARQLLRGGKRGQRPHARHKASAPRDKELGRGADHRLHLGVHLHRLACRLLSEHELHDKDDHKAQAV